MATDTAVPVTIQADDGGWWVLVSKDSTCTVTEAGTTTQESTSTALGLATVSGKKNSAAAIVTLGAGIGLLALGLI